MPFGRKEEVPKGIPLCHSAGKRRFMQFEIGDIIKLKKKHPCGSFEWEVLRVGADFRLKCQGCGHQIMIARKLVEKNVKEIRKPLDSE